MRSRTPLAVLCMTLFLASSVHAQFVPGHIFVVEGQLEGCFEPHAHHGIIWEIDPETGEASVFVALPEALCGGLGRLIFTPDAKRLRASRGFIDNVILEFDAAGNYRVALDGDDGLRAPLSMTYDGDGNFFVANNGAHNIMRFPVDGGPPTIVADFSDGILNPGGIAVTPNGDLFVGVGVVGGPARMLRITASGSVSVFEQYDFNEFPEGIVADRMGNIYVAVVRNGPNEVFRYKAGDPFSKVFFVGWPTVIFNGLVSMKLPGQPEGLYLSTGWFATYRIDLETAEPTLLGSFPGVNTAVGMAVVPLREGDLNRNGSIDLKDFAVLQRCFRGDEVPGGGPGCEAADLDQDGSVNLADYSVLFGAFEGP